MINLNKIEENYLKIKNNIETIAGKNSIVKVIPVTKSVHIPEIKKLIELGFTNFGENRIENQIQKMNTLNLPNIKFDFIGNIQSRKISDIIQNSNLIHSVGSSEIVQKINSRSQQLNLISKVLLQVNISGEIQKSGFTAQDLKENFETFLNLSNIEIYGLMTMAPHTNDSKIISQTFGGLRILRDELKPYAKKTFNELSMGMSEDFPIAIDEGATILRIGSLFFKEN